MQVRMTPLWLGEGAALLNVLVQVTRTIGIRPAASPPQSAALAPWAPVKARDGGGNGQRPQLKGRPPHRRRVDGSRQTARGERDDDRFAQGREAPPSRQPHGAQQRGLPHDAFDE